PAKVIIRDNWFHGMVGGIDFWGAGAYLPSGWTSALANIEITGNKFYDMVAAGPYPGFGILIEDPANRVNAGNDYAVKIENNEFANLPTNVSTSTPGVGIAITRADDIWEAANVYISGNSFSSDVTVGVAFQDGDVSDALVTGNSFSNSVYAILATGIDNGPVDATCNWYNTTDAYAVAAKVSGDVQFLPFSTSASPMNCLGIGPVTVWDDTHTTLISSHMEIQSAIDDPSTLDNCIITVAPGIYKQEWIYVDKSVKIHGPNLGIPGVSSTRGSEAILRFPDDTEGWSGIFYIVADNVVVDGFTISDEGGLSSNEFTGVFSYQASNTQISNNIIDGFNYISLWMHGDGNPAVTPRFSSVIGNYLVNNHGLYHTVYLQGIGGSVTNNTVENCAAGLQIQPYAQPLGGTVENNNFQAYVNGMYHNYASLGSGNWTYSNNSVSAVVPPSGGKSATNKGIGKKAKELGIILPDNQDAALDLSKSTYDWIGIHVRTHGTSGSGAAPEVEFTSGNNVDGTTALTDPYWNDVIGLQFRNTGNNALTKFYNNGISNVDYAIKVYNDANNNSLVDLDNNNFSNYSYAILVEPDMDIDASSGNTYNGIASNSATTIELFTIEDAIIHKIDESSRGLVTVKTGELFVTPLSYAGANTTPLIQRGIDAASAGFIVNVAPGTFAENLNVNKGVTLKGANAGVACGSRTAESILAPASGVPVTIGADGVTLNGFELTAPSSFYGIIGSGYSNQHILFNNIHDVGTTASGANVHSIINMIPNGTATENVTIADNCFNNISSSLLTGYSASAIGILQSSSTGTLTGLNIERNTISNVNVNTGNWPTGKIAYGIIINVGSANYASTNGKVVDALISANEISGLSGFISTGIALEGNTEDAIVQNNYVANLSGNKVANRAGGGYDLQGLKFETNRFVETCTVANNSFATDTYTHGTINGAGYAVANYVPSANGGVLTLGCNWYGTEVYNEIVDNVDLTGRILNKDGCETSFVPYLVSGADNETTTIGFQPTPGTCEGEPVVIASAVPAHIYCGGSTGSILVNFSGGSPNYNIDWGSGNATGITGSPYTISGLGAGSYTITVTDTYGSSDMITAEVLYLPVTNASDMPNTYYPSIQAAIDATTTDNGEIITVCAGTYAEDIIVNKSLDIRGPNFGISPNGGTRVAEAIIVPATSDPDINTGGQIMYLENSASGSSIKGFTFDGDNPVLTSGVSMNGADVDVLEAISGYDGLSNVNISNNIIKNLNYAGIDFYNYTNSGAATTGNTIENNLFDNIVPAQYGVAILIYNNCYTNITNNVMTRVRVGIQTGNFYQADPGNSRSISNNNIQTSRRGIFHNLAYSNASTFTISGNSITASSTGLGTDWDGILLSSLSVPSNSTNNTITGPVSALSSQGYEIWNVKSNAPASIIGGSVTGVDIGVFANNFEGYSSNGGDGAHAVVSGVTITPKTGGVGVKAYDSPSYTGATSALVSIEVKDNCSISGAATGILAEGSDASVTVTNNLATITGNDVGILVKDGADLASVTGNTITNNTLGGIIIESTAGTIGLINNNTISGNGYTVDATHGLGLKNEKATVVDAKNNWWGDASGPYNMPNNTCGLGNAVVGLVDFMPWWTTESGGSSPELLVHNVTKGTWYCKIQDAIDDADAYNTIALAVGNYYESDITINKDGLILQGAEEASTIINPDPAKTDSHDCSPLGGTAHHGIIIKAQHVTIQDLTVDGGTGQGYRMGITTDYWSASTYNDAKIENVTVNNIWYRGIVLRKNGSITTGHKVLGTTVANGGCDEQGFAILGFNASNIEIKECYVEDWKNGIATGNYTGTSSTCDIQDNIVVDVDYQAYTLTLNGAGSTFDGNTATFSSTSNEGTALVTYQDEITLTNNIFTGAKYGISVGYQTLAKDKLVIGAGNVITGPGTTVAGSIGIDVSDYSWAGAARNFTMTGTTVTGYETGVFIDPQSGMTCNADINLNKIYGNAFGIQNDFATAVNATQNWWGANTGPTYAGNPCGTGDAISANVLYNPWRNESLDTDIYQLEAFSLSENSSICAGGTADITLSGSQTGVQYDLYKDGTFVSEESKTGTGNPLIWTVSTGSNATYTVKALNTVNNCELDMTGSTGIYVGPITTLTSVEDACPGSVIDIPVKVKSFAEVGTVSLTIKYDPLKLSYISSTTNPGMMSNFGVTNLESTGTLYVTGFLETASAMPVTLPDDAVLFTPTFTYHGGTTALEFDDPEDDPSYCEYGFGDWPDFTPFCDIPTGTYYINGTITEDLTQPTALCQNITIQLDATGNATITPAQIDNGSTDNCGIASLTLNKTDFTCADIATNPNPVILTVTDNSGNTSKCNATVTVQDVTPPTALCQNITVQLDADGEAVITASQIDNGSSDACGIASMTVSPNTFNCNSMQVSPVLNDLIISEYVEGSSNNKYIEIYNGTSSAVNLADYELHLYANGSASPSTLSSTLSGTLASGANIVYRNSSATVYTGTTTSLSAINFNGNDAVALYKTSTASFVDIFGVIGDASQPNWSLGGNTTINKTLRRNPNVTQGITVNPSGTGAGAFTTLATEWTQYDQDDVSGLGSHSLATSADNPVTLTVTDANGNSSTCNATVTVVDIIDPEITCPADITQDNDPGNCGAVVTINDATATDNCTVVSVNGVRSDALALDAAYPVGETTITWTATDPSGNTASCAQTVTITDNEAPVIACPANVTVQVNASSNPAATGFATATDNCSTAPVVTFSDAWAPGSCTGTGVITRTWTATDESLNTVNCEQTITVTDNYTPAITCPGDITLDNDPGLCSAVATFADPVSYDPGYNEGWESSSYINGDYLGWTEYNSSVISVPSGTNGIASASGSFHGLTQNPVSSYTGIFSRIGGYTSSFGNGYRVRQSVYMNLNDPAVLANTYGWDLSCASSNQSGGHLRDFIFHTASNASGEILVAGSNNSNFARRNDLATLNHFTITTSGWYIFEFVFRDNTGALAVDLNLLDAGGTVLWTETRTNPTDLIASVVGGNRYLWFTFIAVEHLAIDNTSIERKATVTSDFASGYAFPVGTTTVTYTATDACGNATSCNFDVIVNDTELPVITCSENITQTADEGVCGAIVNFAATATDNCSAVVTYSQDPGTLFPVGTTTVTATATDPANNTDVCTFTVTVTDNEAPDISCPENITQTADEGVCGAIVNFAASATDNCSAVVTYSQDPGTLFPVGTTTVTATATDPANNTDVCTFTVTVTDNETPDISCPENITQTADEGVCGAIVNFAATSTDNCS
ncbi:MAG: HYR domain-containing protein, partial [Dehalogenimonas sp.]